MSDLGRMAETIPRGMATSNQMMAASTVSESVTGNASRMRASTDTCLSNDDPRRPTMAAHSSAVPPGHRRAVSSSDGPTTRRRTVMPNCAYQGSSSPSVSVTCSSCWGLGFFPA